MKTWSNRTRLIDVCSFLLTFHTSLNCTLQGLAATQADLFAAGVRITEPLTPSEEQKAFQLPPGFEIELVASEPDISKPMNMAFDAKGQLWVTDTLEYPFPVPLDQKGRDSIKVFSDTDKDGTFDKITTFADGLNIPIGLYPYKNGVIAWSIPHIWWFEDSDGDGIADKREKRFGPLGWERDTHGMNSSFTRGFDGWLYATHGFNNNTTIRGADGSEVVMNSGNTYRIRLDGSRVEQHTFGQVNPFGMCLDPLGNFYTADCHSAPVYQLLRGAYYPSFGKPHDGLGFGPTLMSHAHGSTAICGIVFYDDDQWPLEYRENAFIGNVMTSRLNRDALLATGSSRKAIEKPDLLKTTDPWFRPVNLQLGPDGALYIADFYNRIIGHYEVPLKHPGRDRERGRIWKLTYKGQPGRSSTAHGLPDLTQMKRAELISELGHANITRRMLATHYLVDSGDEKSGKRIRRYWNQGKLKNWKQRVQAIWVLHRLDLLNDSIMGDAVHDEAMEVRTHALHLLAERKNWTRAQQNWVILALQDDHPNVQRAAANALSLHPDKSHIRPLLKVREIAPNNDPQWLHGMRLALRNQLQLEDAWLKLPELRLSQADAESIADVAVAVQSEAAGDYLVWFASKYSVKESSLLQLFRHAARYASTSKMNDLARLVPKKFPNQIGLHLELFESVRQGGIERGDVMTPAIRAWGSRLVQQITQRNTKNAGSWSYRPVEGLRKTRNPWFLQQRSSSDGDRDSTFICSLPPGGESYTGILRSPDFVCPERLSFFLAGHDGYPGKDRQNKNGLRLVDSITGEILRVEYAPRHDTAQPFDWDLSPLKSRVVALEIIDADEGAAYAWLAMGRLEPGVVSFPEMSPSKEGLELVSASQLVGELQLTQFKSNLKAWIIGPVPDVTVSVAAAKALGTFDNNNLPVRLADFLLNQEIADSAIAPLRQAMVTDTHADQIVLLNEMVTALPLKHQQEVVNLLSSHTASMNWLVEQIKEGRLSPLTLRNQNAFNKMEAALENDTIVILKALREQLPTPNHSIQDVIDHRVSIFDWSQADLENGRALFDQACALCHQVGGEGAIVGPQLDGIGSRGLERLIEDILAPNRNIDPAFQSYIITLKNGEVMTGMPRREEGNAFVLANASGQEITVSISDIQSREKSPQSLMPENFGELFDDQQITDLVGFLLKPSAVTESF
jgi:putative heme-binding domain-containing protein